MHGAIPPLPQYVFMTWYLSFPYITSDVCWNSVYSVSLLFCMLPQTGKVFWRCRQWELIPQGSIRK